MHRFSRMHLSPEVARRTLDTIDLEEKSKIAEGIALIGVIDYRKDYLEAGYPCMRDYCMGRLHMSEDKAYRRIQVAKLALRCPEVFEYLADGRLSVTTASVLAPHLEPETAPGLLAAAAFKTQRDIVRLLKERSRPSAKEANASVGESLVESVSGSLAVPQVNSLADLCAPPAGGSPAAPLAVPQVENPRRGRVSPSAAGGYEVRLAITDAEHELLREAQGLLGHAVPSGDPAVLYARAMEHYVAHLKKQRFGVKPGADVPAGVGRNVPKPLRRLVWERDGARCTFESADGHRCEATARLEFDHITPVAMGGETTEANLRILCSAHNRYEAERVLGKDHVQRQREIAQRERERAKAAAKANLEREKARIAATASAERAKAKAETEASRQREKAMAAATASAERAKAKADAEASRERAKARDAEKKARYDDVYSALRHLDYSAAEARRGAELAETIPGASLEECVKLALKELNRAVVQRGERLARCTA